MAVQKMLDLSSRFGRHVNRRLVQERIIWLTTVDSTNTPQPRPVWFHWDGRTILIFSEKNTAKLRHITRNPRVALNLNTDAAGNEVAVLLGTAKILSELPPAPRVKTYLRKYRQGIRDIGMTVEEFEAAYSVPILVEPESMRGL